MESELEGRVRPQNKKHSRTSPDTGFPSTKQKTRPRMYNDWTGKTK